MGSTRAWWHRLAAPPHRLLLLVLLAAAAAPAAGGKGLVELETEEQLKEFLKEDGQQNHMMGFFHEQLESNWERKLYTAYQSAAVDDPMHHHYGMSHKNETFKEGGHKNAAERHYGGKAPSVIVVIPVGSDHYAHHECRVGKEEDATEGFIKERILKCSREGEERWVSFRDRPPLHEMHDEL